MTKAIQRQRRSQADRSSAARAALATAATIVLSEKGFARATSVAIAEQAGLSTGALHHHFATKESLFFAVLDDATARVTALFTDLREGAATSSDLCTKLINSLWSVYGEATYWAVWEINIGWRSDKELSRQLADHRRNARDQTNAAIRNNSYLSERTKSTLLAQLPFILSTMRGMFLETFATRDDRFFRGQLDTLASLLQLQLDEAGASRRRGHVASNK
jgi:AcrR family transcriptional regulator